ncbi:hypothetical protein HN51_065846 [Arachis hypogaea]|uniref:PHD-type domain-containing protein n=1 Tax=Arachis hypogaea TaxID=3818 RepID=A0A444ZHY2_ARAHY|nr:uncharacterized protein F54F2.2 isoform X1 [Arachis ipaensis]XP_025646830.1 uncharacterized protein F54F2.2-like isoform X1 [Arachis hypogaea]RYR13805.1 hypothetical protein Ahy_B04g070600 isoform B [Arachis hypogaea]
MDSSSSGSTFYDLPPLKRLRLQLQQQQQHTPLPAKKRKDSRNAAFYENLNPNPIPPSATAYCLPAKKRVCAFQPFLPQNDAVSPFQIDLNLEYQETDKKLQSLPSSPQKRQEQYLDGNGNVNDCDDVDVDVDDGILCCVCQSTDGDPTDPIVFCDGCDLMVHASCYGNPLSKSIPDGDWFCERCRFKDEEAASDASSVSCCCCLCPVTEGAMKKTTDNRWAHIVCALLVPEVFFLDPEGREGIDCSMVPKKRWLERCYVCDSCDGCAVVCSEPKCGLAFHVTCGIKEELCIEYKQGKKGATIVAGFCKTHTQIWDKQQQSGKYKIVAVEDEV